MESLFPLDPFILRALAAGIGVAVVAAVMGCFVVWRRMAYFGDSLAHSALLGIALGLLWQASNTFHHLAPLPLAYALQISTVLVCSLFAVLLVWLQHKRVLATDTLLGILAHAALSFGMVALSLLQARVDLQAYLFGDILTVTGQELWWIYIGGAIILTVLWRHWDALVLMTVHEDLARAEGVRGFRSQLMLMFLMTLVVAISIRMVGILLITSMLIIPAATARQLARSPESMAVLAALLGACAVLGGMAASLTFDTPTGPTIVTAATLLFVLLLPFARIASRR